MISLGPLACLQVFKDEHKNSPLSFYLAKDAVEIDVEQMSC